MPACEINSLPAARDRAVGDRGGDALFRHLRRRVDLQISARIRRICADGTHHDRRGAAGAAAEFALCGPRRGDRRLLHADSVVKRGETIAGTFLLSAAHRSGVALFVLLSELAAFELRRIHSPLRNFRRSRTPLFRSATAGGLLATGGVRLRLLRAFQFTAALLFAAAQTQGDAAGNSAAGGERHNFPIDSDPGDTGNISGVALRGGNHTLRRAGFLAGVPRMHAVAGA